MTAAQARELATTPELPKLTDDEAHLFNRTMVKVREHAIGKHGDTKRFQLECNHLIGSVPRLKETFTLLGYAVVKSDNGNYIIKW